MDAGARGAGWRPGRPWDRGGARAPLPGWDCAGLHPGRALGPVDRWRARVARAPPGPTPPHAPRRRVVRLFASGPVDRGSAPSASAQRRAAREHVCAARDRAHARVRAHERRELRPRRVLHAGRLRHLRRSHAEPRALFPCHRAGHRGGRGGRRALRPSAPAAAPGRVHRHDHAAHDRSVDRHAERRAARVGRGSPRACPRRSPPRPSCGARCRWRRSGCSCSPPRSR